LLRGFAVSIDKKAFDLASDFHRKGSSRRLQGGGSSILRLKGTKMSIA
jgi:hypothetical protein